MLNQVGLRVKPLKMVAPTRNDLTNPQMIMIDWIALIAPDNGDSEILGYHVMWTLTSSQNWVDLNLPTTNYTNTRLYASQSLV